MEQQSTYFKENKTSSRRKSGSSNYFDDWIPAFAGMTTVVDFGQTQYEKILELQRNAAEAVALHNAKELILITEHFPVYTCGRATKDHERPKQDIIPIVNIERGGGLTYHGPGQIVGYPILNLNKRKLSIPNYLCRLENTLISVLAEFGVEAHTRKEYRAGVWVGPKGAGEKKLISIGIAVRRWVTFHGFALNVDCDLTPFRNASPCGMSGDKVTSLKDLGHTISKEELLVRIKEELLNQFF